MIAAAGVLSGAAVLGGCAQSGDTVASVDGTRISRAQFTSTLNGAREVSRLSSDQVLSVMIQGQVAARVAAQRNIRITDADRNRQLNPAVLRVPDARAIAYDLADIQIVSKAIGQNAFGKALATAQVTVNPRFGSWNPKSSLAVVPGTGSLSQVAQNRPS